MSDFDYAAWIVGRTRLELNLPQYRKAAVLVALTLEDRPRVLLTVRSSALPTHAGQISFPGGRLEAGETVLEAALREAFEEVALDSSEVVVLGLFDDIFTPAGFQVTPVLARIPPALNLKLSAEVVQILWVPLEDLARLHPEKLERVSPDGVRHSIYRFPWKDAEGVEHDIWGMTARILYGLLHPELGSLEY